MKEAREALRQLGDADGEARGLDLLEASERGDGIAAGIDLDARAVVQQRAPEPPGGLSGERERDTSGAPRQPFGLEEDVVRDVRDEPRPAPLVAEAALGREQR